MKVTITAFDNLHLPSPILLDTWLQQWAATTQAQQAQWSQFVINKATAVTTVQNMALEDVESVVEPTIDKYNETHPGNDAITVTVA